MQELAELAREPSSLFQVRALEDDLFELHFTIRGPIDSAFQDGLYHGRMLLPPEYPYKPPEIMLLTPNGRFETGKRICLSVTQHHTETWQPSWGIRTILTALIGFMPTRGDGAVGALDFSDDERRHLARASQTWSCARCGMNHATWSGDAVDSSEQETNTPKQDIECEESALSDEPEVPSDPRPISRPVSNVTDAAHQPKDMIDVSQSAKVDATPSLHDSPTIQVTRKQPNSTNHRQILPRQTATDRAIWERIDRHLTYIIVALLCLLTTVWFI
jgi:ubiquitin-conjugating enzyme E2 J1